MFRLHITISWRCEDVLSDWSKSLVHLCFERRAVAWLRGSSPTKRRTFSGDRSSMMKCHPEPRWIIWRLLNILHKITIKLDRLFPALTSPYHPNCENIYKKPKHCAVMCDSSLITCLFIFSFIAWKVKWWSTTYPTSTDSQTYLYQSRHIKLLDP